MSRMTSARRLVEWFRLDARPLPWRTEPRDPYLVLVSELMAQQTQIDRVVPRFEAFVARFPDLAALAAAPEQDVVESWSGLGYYRRARLLHAAAREIAAGSGELPRTAAELERLPGVGPYTAAAVASMVFGEAVPVMDGNVARVAARVLALDGDPRTRPGRSAVLDWVAGMLRDASQPGEVNEALMELGARICAPTDPGCDVCPLAPDCRALAEGDPEAHPPPRRLRAPIRVHWVTAIVEDAAGRWLLHRVDDGPILRGLWLPPFAEVDPGRPVERQAAALVPFGEGAAVELLDTVRHSITHRRIEVVPAAVRVAADPDVPPGWAWADPAAPELPTSSLLGKLLRSVRARPRLPFAQTGAAGEK